ncbi:hypothetical protein LJB42_004816 [Komagataella kurtzmanii]|nr:hypothetical protein LJB42_004816 [Komagataella kurtzmanii]
MNTKIPQQEIIPLRTDLAALGNRINAETRNAHNKIDKMMTLKFALALRDPKIYRQGIQMYYHIFSAIEDSLDRELAKETPWTSILKQVYKPTIRRSERLYKDLLFYYDNDPKKFAEPIMPEQIRFIRHIKESTAEKPYLLLAYMHVMYLALFAGGRIFRSKLAKAVGLFPQVVGKTTEEISLEATNFFRFECEDEDAFRIVYKRDYELATRNNLTETEKQEIIKESQLVFEENATCVKEIESHNLRRLQEKVLYKVATKGYYVVLAVLIMLAVFLLKTIASRLLL